jgi:hypothetical protein
LDNNVYKYYLNIRKKELLTTLDPERQGLTVMGVKQKGREKKRKRKKEIK